MYVVGVTWVTKYRVYGLSGTGSAPVVWNMIAVPLMIGVVVLVVSVQTAGVALVIVTVVGTARLTAGVAFQ